MTDPISHFIAKLKNASVLGKPSVIFPYSKPVFAVAALLEKGEWVGEVARRGKKTGKFIEVKLRYDAEGKPRIAKVERLSKPSRRRYEKVKNIRPVRSGRGKVVLSTTKGMLFGEDARAANVGGEPLFSIW